MLDIDAYKSQLLTLRNEVTQRVTSIAKDLHHEENKIEKDFAEQATQQENDEVLLSLGDEAKTTLLAIDNALIRMKNGNYGLCVSCGQPINEQRLKAVPFASDCIACAESNAETREK